jgi:hypothetical protein
VFGWRAGKEKPKPCASVFFIWRFIDQSRYATLRCDKMPLKVPLPMKCLLPMIQLTKAELSSNCHDCAIFEHFH